MNCDPTGAGDETVGAQASYAVGATPSSVISARTRCAICRWQRLLQLAARTVCILERPPRFVVFTGKGGVGKTSVACATAVRLAESGAGSCS